MSWLGTFSNYYRDSVAELKKVSFPTKQETIQATLATFFILCVVAAFLGLVDLVFFKVMESLTAV